jgi:hypothetical protein
LVASGKFYFPTLRLAIGAFQPSAVWTPCSRLISRMYRTDVFLMGQAVRSISVVVPQTARCALKKMEKNKRHLVRNSSLCWLQTGTY